MNRTGASTESSDPLGLGWRATENTASRRHEPALQEVCLKFAQAGQFLKGIPYIKPRAAHDLYEFVLRGGVSDIIELGFAHGVSTCYMAAALHERGNGTIVSIDLSRARTLEPNLDAL